jgi:hypothetical protein
VNDVLRFAVPTAALLTLALLSGDARATDAAEILETRHHSYESPQHFAFELRVAPYRPQIDEDPGLNSAPYQTVFGDAYRVELAAEMDWQVLRIPHVGTIGPGLSAGITQMTARAKRAGTQDDSGENTSLSIYPMYAVAVLRVDFFQRELRIPLVPYVKGGVGLAFWRASNDAGTSEIKDAAGNATSRGLGHTWGTHFAVGVALHLNAFDPTSARNLDETTGINNTYLFGEYMMSDLKGIGQQNVLFVGTRTFLGGLAFEF